MQGNGKEMVLTERLPPPSDTGASRPPGSDCTYDFICTASRAAHISKSDCLEERDMTNPLTVSHILASRTLTQTVPHWGRKTRAGLLSESPQDISERVAQGVLSDSERACSIEHDEFRQSGNIL